MKSVKWTKVLTGLIIMMFAIVMTLGMRIGVAWAGESRGQFYFDGTNLPAEEDRKTFLYTVSTVASYSESQSINVIKEETGKYAFDFDKDNVMDMRITYSDGDIQTIEILDGMRNISMNYDSDTDGILDSYRYEFISDNAFIRMRGGSRDYYNSFVIRCLNTVTINANDGKFSDNATSKTFSVRVGDTLAETDAYQDLLDENGNPVLTRSGYKLDGYVTADTEENFDPETDPVNSNIAVKAVWKQVYTIRIYANNGKFSDNSTSKDIRVGSGEKISDSDDYQSLMGEDGALGIKRDNYELAGFSTSSSTSYSSASLINSAAFADTVITGDKTYYAIWRPYYTITINANGGAFPDEAVSKSIKVLAGTKIRESADYAALLQEDGTFNITRDGYELEGFSTSSSTSYSSAIMSTLTDATSNGNKTYYAIWRPYVTVTIDARVGAFPDNETSKSIKVLAGTEIGESADYAALLQEDGTLGLTRDGYQLVGYSTYNYSSYSTYSSSQISSLSVLQNTYVSSDRTYYVVWRKICTVTVKANGGKFYDGTTEKKYTLLEGETTSGYIPLSYDYYDYYVSREGYVYDGLYKSSGSSWSSSTKVTGDVDLMVGWIKYIRMTVDANGGTYPDGTYYHSTRVRAGSNIYVGDWEIWNCVKKGYKIAGLATDPAGKGEVKVVPGGEFIMLSGGYYDFVPSGPFYLEGNYDEDFTIYIKWEESDDLQIDSGYQYYWILMGQEQELYCNASGDGLTYQWQISTTGGSSYENIAGANEKKFTVSSTDLQAAGLKEAYYRCKVTDSYNRSKTGKEYDVQTCYGFVQSPPALLSVEAGETPVFSVKPCEGYTSLEWQAEDAVGNTIDLSTISGVTGIDTDTLSLEGDLSWAEGASFRCVMTVGSDSYESSWSTIYSGPSAEQIDITIPEPKNGKETAGSMPTVQADSKFRVASSEWYLAGDELDDTLSGEEWQMKYNKLAGRTFDDGWYLAVVELCPSNYFEEPVPIVPGKTKIVVNGKEISSNHIVRYTEDGFKVRIYVPFFVVGNLSTATVTLPYENVEYTGEAFTPEPTVKLKNRTLTAGTDYTISYSDNTEAGTARVIITGMEEINGSIEKTFTITPVNLATSTVSVTGEFVFNRKKQTPKPVVKISGKVLNQNKDYTLVYQNNMDAGTATVTVEGKGNYTGSKSAKFTIVPTGLKDENVMVPDQIYTGDDLKPSATITSDGAVLKEGKDYTASYKNNRYAGTATVTIVGQGNYTGTVNRKFTISKATRTITADSFVRNTNMKKKQTINVNAKTIGGKLSYSSSNKEVTVSKSGKITIPKGFIGRSTISIVSDATENCEKYVKKITVTVKPLSVKLKNVKNSAKGKMTVKWKKSSDKNASGYQIQYADNKNFNKARKVNVKGYRSTSKSVGKLLKGKTYYVRIRTWKKVGSKTFYSDWSKEKKVTIRK